MNTVDEVTTAWAAGLFEGEGTFSFHFGVAKSVAISMTDKDILDRVCAAFGGKVSPITKRQGHWKDAWIWSVTGDNAVAFINAIMPHLGQRRAARGQEFLDDIAVRKVKREKSAAEVKQLRQDIRAVIDTGLTQREIAAMFDVERSYVAKVKSGKFV